MSSNLIPLDELDRALAGRLRAAVDDDRPLDWDDVERRADASTPKHRHHRPLLLAAAIVAAVAIVAPALAFHGWIVNFFSSAPAPPSVVRQFGRLDVMSVHNPPRLFPKRARRVTSEQFRGATASLYVTPTKGGGFCGLWSSNHPLAGLGLACLAHRSDAIRPGVLGNFDYSTVSGNSVESLAGTVLAAESSVRVHFSDGGTAVVPYTWVTAPIDAGFFLYPVPTSRVHGNGRPVALTVERAGNVLARVPIVLDEKPLDRLVTHTGRWGQPIQTTAEAIWSRRRLLFGFNNTDGAYEYLYVTPSRLGASRICVVSLITTGCEARQLPPGAVQLQIQRRGAGSRGLPLLNGRVAANVARVELHFQDGTTISIHPRHGFVLWMIPALRGRQGHRLVTAAGISAAGDRLGTAAFNPKEADVYSCQTPHDYGYGLLRCP